MCVFNLVYEHLFFLLSLNDLINNIFTKFTNMKNSFLSRFAPKEPKFFPMFTQMAEVVVVASDLLIECIKCNNEEERVSHYKKIKEQERIGDQINRTIFEELSKSFITPFDREDIHNLTSTIDNVIDRINSSAKKIAIYNPRPICQKGIELGELINKDALLIKKAMEDLELIRRNPKKLIGYYTQLHDIENLADDVYESFIINLFKNETDSIELVKIKEIMNELEKTTDEAEQVGKAIKTIIIKYA